MVDQKLFKSKKRNLTYRLRLRRDRFLGYKIVHFIHVRKAGGTAIRNMLATFKSKEKVKFYTYGHQASLLNLPKKDEVFFVLRHPFERFVSGFNDRLNCGQPARNIPWYGIEPDVFENFKTANELAEALSSPNLAESKLATRAFTEMANVKSRYSDWGISEVAFKAQTQRFKVIGFQGNLNAMLAALKTEYGLDSAARLPTKGNQSNISNRNDDKELSALAKENLAKILNEDLDTFHFFQGLFKV